MGNKVPIVDFHDCYDVKWRDLIVPDAMRHPAKFSRGLVERILRHMLERGWVRHGEVVFDAFGGVGTGGIVAASMGMRWIGVELEPRFYRCAVGYDCEGFNTEDYDDLCPSCMAKIKREEFEAEDCDVHLPPYELPEPHHFRGNFELHRHKWAAVGDPQPVMICGDSRRAAEIVRASGALSSPPYSGSQKDDRTVAGGREVPRDGSRNVADGERRVGPAYGSAPGQLGSMEDGDLDAALTSPPYVGGGHHPDQTGAWNTNGLGQGGTADTAGYGSESGQLGKMQPGDVEAVLGSPPYADSWHQGEGDKHVERMRAAGYSEEYIREQVRMSNGPGGNKQAQSYGAEPGQLGKFREGDLDAVLTSPPYADQDLGGGDGQRKMSGSMSAEENKATKGCKGLHGNYGSTAGQLGKLREGDLDASVSSPPFSGTEQPCASQAGTMRDGGYEAIKAPTKRDAVMTSAAGQIGAMPEGLVADAVASSPPWESTEGSLDASKFRDPAAFAAEMSARDAVRSLNTPESRAAQFARAGVEQYGSTPGNVGNQQGETFWSEARKIVEQTYLLLKPGGVAAWVLKAYVKEGKVVDFPGNWRRLCEAVGFETIEEARAWLVKETRENTLFGEVVKKTSRKSFFRRLAEKKGSPEINYEVVLFCRKR